MKIIKYQLNELGNELIKVIDVKADFTDEEKEIINGEKYQCVHIYYKFVGMMSI